MQATILFIDDSKVVHAMLDDILAVEGHKHLHAYDADQGFWFAKRANPDLILLDVVMPRVSGFDLCKALKSDPQTAHIPVMFLSGTGDTFNKVQGLDLGAIDYITKPFDETELQARVRAALRTKRLVDMLANTAQVDALTGLRNRQHFDRRLDEELAAMRRFGRTVSLVLLDIDHFKCCNDQFGHPFGDRVLQSVAEVLQEASRVVDVPCRFGGEEFVVILPETEIEGALVVAERIRQGIQSIPLSCREQRLTITASGGVASSSQAGNCECVTSKSLVQAADEALYRAKNNGRNRIECSQLKCTSPHDDGLVIPSAESGDQVAIVSVPSSESAVSAGPIWQEEMAT